MSTKPIRGYHHMSRAWYARACTSYEKPDYIDEERLPRQP